MATERFANNIQTTLNGTINNAVTSLTVASATGFPSSAQYRILVDSELMLVTGGAGTTTWTVTRGIEGTTAATHASTTDVIHVLTAGALGVVSDPAAAVPGLRTLGTGATQAAPGNDARFAAVSGTGIPTVVNVKDAAYGATGDGVTDDTTALAAALAALPANGALYFPPGTYITTQLTNKSDYTMFGYGATIKRKTAATGALFNTASIRTNIAVEGLVFDNNNAAAGNPIFTFVPGTSNISWTNCKFTNYNAAIIIFSGSGGVQSTNVKINDCSLIGNLSAGSNHISTDLKDVSWVWFSRNYCENFGGFKDESSGSAAGPMHHLFCRDNLFRSCTAMCLEIRNNGDGVIEDVVITGNQAYGVGNAGTQKGLSNLGEGVGASSTSFLRRAVVTNNIVKDYWGQGICIGGGPSPGTMEDIVISNNMFDATPESEVVDLARGSTMGIQTVNAYRFTITGNNIRGCGRSGIRVVQSTSIGSKHGTISSNQVSECCQNTSVAPPNDAESGILCYGNVNDVTITGNICKDMGSAGGLGVAGIGTDTHSASTAANDHVITGNRCLDSRGSPFQDFGIRVGHTVGSSTQPTNFTISNNDVRGNVTAGVKVFSTTYKNHNIWNNLGDTSVAKGQFSVYDATPNLRDLAPGPDNLVLTTDSSAALGVKWATSGGGPITKVVASDITITAQTTLQDITGLGVAIGTSATEIWLAKFWLLVNGSNATMDIKFGFTVPTATTMRWGFDAGGGQSSFAGWGTTAAGTSPVVLLTEASTPPILGTVSGVIGTPIIAVIYGGGTAGTAQIKFAQQISDAGTLKILKGSAAEIVPLSS